MNARVFSTRACVLAGSLAGLLACWPVWTARDAHGADAGATAGRPPPARAPTMRAARHVSLDQAWRFVKADVLGADKPDFDDSGWRLVDLPHDWAIEGPFEKRWNPQTGGLDVAGVAWYRKRFRLPAGAAGRSTRIEIDGAMANARVFLNGHDLGGRPYGYIGFGFELDHFLNPPPADNVIAVRLAPEDNASRWYPGAGLYRHVWLDTTGDVHVAHWGTSVVTPAVTADRATVVVRTTLRNHRADVARVTLETAILDPRGRPQARATQRQVLPAAAEATAEASLEVDKPHRWDVDDPQRYTVETTVRDGARMLDRFATPFGIRTVEMDKVKGFVLNGRPLKLHGVCLHHDLGALGAAVSGHAIERRLRTLKEMGANAIRTAHNPPAPELLDWADRLGLVVMDEAFDVWRKPKVKNGYQKYFDAWAETDLRDMIRRDRNHPSVVLWSIGNEVMEQSEPDGWKLARRLTDVCHQEDPTRPVTAAFNFPEQAIANRLPMEVDVPGFNYQPTHYAELMNAHPDWVIVGSETASDVSSRGVYQFPLEKYDKHPSFQITSYDIIAPRWGYPPDVEFDAQDRLPAVLGEFVWTGADYLGEPTPYFWSATPGSGGTAIDDWPAHGSYFGILDLAGFPKDRYYLYQSVWTSAPMVHVLPHWNWTGREGQPIPVMVYSNAEEVELSLNGQALGRKARGAEPVRLPVGPRISKDGVFASKYRRQWMVPYQPGTLRAVAYTGGKPVATDERKTSGPPARLRVEADHRRLRSDGDDLAFLTVRIEDAAGNPCPLADNVVTVDVSGPARIAAVDNGNAASVEPFQSSQRHAFAGLMLAIIRPTRGHAGAIRVKVESEGLRGAELALSASAPGAAAIPAPE